jgi:hypothetical protein
MEAMREAKTREVAIVMDIDYRGMEERRRERGERWTFQGGKSWETTGEGRPRT